MLRPSANDGKLRLPRDDDEDDDDVPIKKKRFNKIKAQEAVLW